MRYFSVRDSHACAVVGGKLQVRPLRFHRLCAGIDRKACGVELVAVHAERAGRCFDFDSLAGSVDVHVLDEHSSDQQATDNENYEAASYDGENP